MIGVSLLLIDVNDDGPILVVTARFLESSQAVQQTALYPSIFSDIFQTNVQETFGIKPQCMNDFEIFNIVLISVSVASSLDSILSHLSQSSETGNQFDKPSISLFYEGVLLIHDHKELKAIVLSMLGDICNCSRGVMGPTRLTVMERCSTSSAFSVPPSHIFFSLKLLSPLRF